MPKKLPPELSDADLDRLVAKVLGQAAVAKSGSGICASLKPTYRGDVSRVREALSRLAAAGAAHVWPGGRRGRPLYGVQPFETYVRELLVQHLRSGPRTAGELKSAVPKAGQPAVPRLLKELVAAGVVFPHPQLGRRRPFGLSPADPFPYVATELKRVVSALARRGLPEAAVRESVARWVGQGAAPPGSQEPAADDGDAIVARMRELNPQVAHGAIVYLPHLRAAMRDRFPDKLQFDRAVLALLEQRRAQLQAHPVPSQLTAKEREGMIDNGTGGFYMGIGLRV